MLPICYSSDEVGAPTLNNVNGSLVGVLDAVLTTGFNPRSVTSITVASNVATAVIPTHSFVGGVGRRVLFAGASDAALNGVKTVTVVDANTVTFPAPGVANGVASGTLTAKRAPLGWTKLFSGTNKAVYQRTDPQATSMVLRVDDTGSGVASTTYARARMAESATDVDTLTAIAPLDTHLSGGVYVSKGTSDATAKRWVAVGDGRTLWFFSDDSAYPFSSYSGLHGFGFGDVTSWRSGGDAYGCLIWGGTSSTGANNTHYSTDTPTLAGGIYVARSVNHIGGSTAVSFRGRATGQYAGASTVGHAPYPSPVDGGCAIETAVLVPEYVTTGFPPFRGTARGVAHPLGAVTTVLHGQTLPNLVGTNDTFLCVGCTAQGSGSSGALLFNLTSEW